VTQAASIMLPSWHVHVAQSEAQQLMAQHDGSAMAFGPKLGACLVYIQQVCVKLPLQNQSLP
jgi:hypothetical protein